MASRRERRRAIQRKEQARIWGVVAGVAMALVPSLVPRLPVVIVISLSVIWLISWIVARDGYKYRLAFKWAVLVMLVHGAALAGMGYWLWPRITISPSRVSFSGFPGETFNFSVRNGRADDVYDVQIPFFIGRNKHFENKFSVKVIGGHEPGGPFRNYYNYCFGVKGDGVISHVQQNEQEVLLVHVPHLISYGSGAFSITYAGGDKLPDITPGTPDFLIEPFSYSPNSGTVDVRGDYRICKFDMSPAGER